MALSPRHIHRVVATIAAIALGMGLTVVATQPASAAPPLSFTVDGLTYTYTSAGKVTVTGAPSASGSVVVPSSVTNLSLTYAVVGIGASAFLNKTTITSLTLPDSVLSIGANAVKGATGLGSVSLGTGLTTIGANAFYGDTALTSVVIPDSVTSIELSAFYGDASLSSVTIGSGVTTIGPSVFKFDPALVSVTIPDSVTSLGTGVFFGDTALVSVTLGRGLTSIASNVFRNASALQDVYFLGAPPATITAAGGVNASLGSAPGLKVHFDRSYLSPSFANGFTAPTWLGYNTTANPFLVSYDANGGSGVPSAVSQSYVGDALNLPLVGTMAKDGYVFQGWSTSAGDANGVGATALTSPYSPSSSLTLFAVWAPLAPFDNSPAPTISGTTTVGQTLTAVPGAWSPAAESYTYQWKRDGSAINLATSSTYDLQPADAGAVITVTVTATTAGYTSTAQTSADSAAIATADFVTTPTPIISGTTTVGETLSADPGTWSPAADSYTYQWKRDGSAINLATSSTYDLQPADAGAVITVTVTATTAGYTSTAQTSADTAVIATADFVTTPTPTISGTTTVGETLTAVPGTWSPVADSYTYVWKRDGVVIDLATASTYVLQSADAGAVITVTVTATTAGYTSSAQTSADTAAIAVADFVTTPTPTISGTTTVGETLTVDERPIFWSPSVDSFTYQWSRGGVAIELATASTYVVQVADAGQVITVTVTGVKAGYTSSAQTSADSAAIATAAFGTAPTPTISGTTTVGQTLTANTGTWSPAAESYTYQWKRDGSAINLATSSTYDLEPADAGAVITVTVTATTAGYTSTAQTSADSAAIATADFVTTPTPTISGTTTVGETLTAVPGTWSPAADGYTYVWKRGGLAINSATGSTYVLQVADAGAVITVTVTASTAGYTSTAMTSAGTSLIGIPFVSTSVPTISGSAAVGQRLSVVPGAYAPGAAFAYQWKRDGVAIAGAVGASYAVDAADLGTKITVTVTAFRNRYTSVVKTTAETAAVVKGTFVASPVPTVSGAASVGQRLTVVTGAYSAAPAFNYVWKRDGNVIPGGVGAGYTLAAADLSAKITVEVTAYRNGFTSVVQTTAETDAVTKGTFVASPVPTISGTATVGQRLTAVTGAYSASPRFTYVWQRDGVAISGAVGATYGVGAADLGKKITVEVTAYRDGFTSVVQTTSETATVTR